MTALTFAKRGIKIFFRSKASVFFSMLSGIIVIVLYVLFLRDVSFSGSGVEMKVIDAWTMGGAVGVTIFTTAFGALEIMVNDDVSKINKDFLSAPVSRGSIVLGYMISSVTVSMVMSLITLAFAQIYVLIYGGEFFTFFALLKTIGCIAVGSLCSASIAYFIVSFIKSTNTFGVISTIEGTLIGFISGAYFPLSIVPEGLQYVIKVFPVAHMVSLIRQSLLENLTASWPSQQIEAFGKEMGVNFWLGDWQVPWWASVLFLVAVSAIFFALAAQKLKIKKRG